MQPTGFRKTLNRNYIEDIWKGVSHFAAAGPPPLVPSDSVGAALRLFTVQISDAGSQRALRTVPAQDVKIALKRWREWRRRGGRARLSDTSWRL